MSTATDRRNVVLRVLRALRQPLTATQPAAPPPPSGPRHIREILDRVVWTLLLARETARERERP